MSTDAQVVQAALAFAEACADCEDYRRYGPREKWEIASAAKQHRMSELLAQAMQLTPRCTLPPEWKFNGPRIVWASTGVPV